MHSTGAWATEEEAKLRNQALHGDPSEPQKADVSQARSLLVRMLKAELHLPERMPWEDVLRDLSATVGYKVLGDAREFDEEGRLS